MNKTLSIGLAGYSFMIEEHAYIKLSDYLAALRGSLDAAEADEVMHDIEIRMVEIFRDALGRREVLNDADVEAMISQIGRPEQIEEQEEALFSEPKTAETESRTTQKQLFRDPENAKLGGVCAGLAQYAGMSANTMRIIWVAIAVVGIFSAHISTLLEIFIYIILWIVLPKAQTAADFLKMKGKPMNFDNLKSESNKIVQFATEGGQKVNEMYKESRPFIRSTGSGFWNVLRYILGAIFALTGIALLFASLMVFGAGINTDHIQLPGMLQFALEDAGLRYSALAFGFLSIFIPSMVCLFIAMRLLSPKTRLNYTGYVLGALAFVWLILLGTLGFRAMQYKTMYSGDKEESDNVAISTTSDSILIDLKKVAIPTSFKSFGDDVFTDKKLIYQHQYPYVDVTRKDGDFAPYLIIKKEANGYNQPMRMEVPVEVQGNKILVPNYVSFPYEYRMRSYHTHYELVVPKQKKVIALSKDLSINDDASNDDDDDDDAVQNSTKTPADSTATVKNVTIQAGSDSVVVNGKKVSGADADRMLREADKKAFRDVSITINNGKKEIRVRTN